MKPWKYDTSTMTDGDLQRLKRDLERHCANDPRMTGRMLVPVALLWKLIEDRETQKKG